MIDRYLFVYLKDEGYTERKPTDGMSIHLDRGTDQSSNKQILHGKEMGKNDCAMENLQFNTSIKGSLSVLPCLSLSVPVCLSNISPSAPLHCKVTFSLRAM